MIFSSMLKNDLLCIDGDQGGRSIIRKRQEEVRIVDFSDDILGKDIDTWDEYIRWRWDRMLGSVVIIRGGGDIATGIAYRLFKCGFRILLR